MGWATMSWMNSGWGEEKIAPEMSSTIKEDLTKVKQIFEN